MSAGDGAAGSGAGAFLRGAYGLDHPSWVHPDCFFYDTPEQAGAAILRTYGDHSNHIVVGPVAQVRADERQKVAALLAGEGTVEKVAEALNAADDAALVETNFGRLTATYTDAARAALDAVAGLIGGEGE